MRGRADAEFYKIQVQFVDLQSNEVLFNGLYRIRKEAADQPPSDQSDDTQPPPDGTPQEPATPQVPAEEAPTTNEPASNGSL